MPESLPVIYSGPLGHTAWLLEGLETELRQEGNQPLSSNKNSGY